MEVEGGLLRNRNGTGERGRGLLWGKYDKSTLHTCMKTS
jgi:hypothetical protein